ncbi:(deoxy)nucleoside triphosphate pyrophosphohydrolase [Prevotella sp.]|uniref:(deoxy)nucleoside triphosphate pyrophosphohydrolase n=1 Tax=Prevotella sp. TaxID=59823 RepID=UPI004026A3E9
MNTEERKHIEVVAAIICDGNRIFATQRGYGEWKDWWEFPGGKMEPGETPQAALQREIREELATEIAVENLLTTVDYDYPNFHLTMYCYICKVKSGSLTLLEHEAAKWLTRDELSSVKWLPADEEVVDMIKTREHVFLKT